MKAVLNSYQNATNLKISEVFKPKDGWIRIWGQNLVDLTMNNILKAKNEGATHINVRLTDEFGVVKYPDFSISELIK